MSLNNVTLPQMIADFSILPLDNLAMSISKGIKRFLSSTVNTEGVAISRDEFGIVTVSVKLTNTDTDMASMVSDLVQELCLQAGGNIIVDVISAQSACCFGSELVATDLLDESLSSAFEKTARAFPNKKITYYKTDGSKFTLDYEDLFVKAQKIASGIVNVLGSNSETVILVSGHIGEYLAAFWGCVLAGKPSVTVMLASDYARADESVVKLEQALEVTKSPLVLCCDEGFKRLTHFAPVKGKLYKESTLSRPVHIQDTPYLSRSDNPIFFQLTSGSTGRPKMIPLTEKAILLQILSVNQACRYRSEDISLNWLPYDHVIGLLASHVHDTVLGREQVHLPTSLVTQSPLSWLSKMDEHGATHCFAPNFIFDLVLNQVESEKPDDLPDLTHVKQIVSGGEMVAPTLIRKFQQLFLQSGLKPHVIQPSYGMAEAAAGLTFEQEWSFEHGTSPVPSNSGAIISSLGEPLPGIAIRVVDEQKNVLDEGEIGEVQILASKICPQTHDWFKTGDLGFLLKGKLYVSGRIKELIIINGANFYSHDLEKKVEEIDGIRHGFVAAVADNHTTQEQVAIFFVSEAANSKTLNNNEPQLCGRIRRQLATHFGISPSMVIPLPERDFPKTSAGKIRRSLLQDLVSDGTFTRTPLTSDSAAPLVEQNEVHEKVTALWQEVLGLTHCDFNTNFFELGGSSLLASRLIGRVNETFDINLDSMVLFEASTINTFSDHLLSGSLGADQTSTTVFSNPSADLNRDVAIIGMSGQFPSAPDLETFWDKLVEGEDMISTYTEEELFGVHEQSTLPEDYVLRGGSLADNHCFDSNFFSYSLNDAELMDPQARLLHQNCWHAIEQAGYGADTSSNRIGVFLGTSARHNRSWFSRAESKVDTDQVSDRMAFETLADRDFTATRIAYSMNLTGPAVTVQSACSTGLVAIHHAVEAIRGGRCELALAGAAAVTSFTQGYRSQSGMMLSKSGVCRPFDAKADGTIFTDGVGVVALKSLSSAKRDEDNILAVIKGTGINNDGHNKIGYLAPSVEGQVDVVRRALVDSNISPDTISYVETHGTGTSIGDPIEVKALERVFSHRTGNDCILGSVKSNLGHTDVAAGIAGLFKVILAMRHQVIPGTRNYVQANPDINFDSLPFAVNSKKQIWENSEGPLRAGVSAFGIGGTNAHVILEQPKPRVDGANNKNGWYVLPVSAKSPSALEAHKRQIIDFINNNHDLSMENLAFTLNKNKVHFSYRSAMVCKVQDGAVSLLERANEQTDIERKQIFFVLPGQGSQFSGMFVSLYHDVSAYRDIVDRCLGWLSEPLQTTLTDFLTTPDKTEPLSDTTLVQPALFICQYAIGKILMDSGIKPDGMLGHSIGEYAVAALSGVMTAKDGLQLVVRRAELMSRTKPGLMLAASIGEEEASVYLSPSVSLAAINGDAQCVFSGGNSAIRDVMAQLEQVGIACKLLPVDRANHSSRMDSILSEFSQILAESSLHAPVTPYLSSSTGFWVGSEVMNPEYWVNHLRQTVQFNKGLKEIMASPNAVFVDIGPGKSLGSMIKAHPASVEGHHIVQFCRHQNESRSDAEVFYEGLAKLYENGIDIDWYSLGIQSKGKTILVPDYPFDKQSFTLVSHGEISHRNFFELPKDSQALATSLRPRPRLETVYRAPQQEHEIEIINIWETELGIKGIGVDDELYELGGDSLVLLKIVNKVNRFFSIDLSVASAMNAKTVYELAMLISLLQPTADDDDEMMLDLGELL